MNAVFLPTLLLALAMADPSNPPATPAGATTDALAAVHSGVGKGASDANGAFDALDTDHDGMLTRGELARHPKAAHMAMVDENGDGVLSRDEFDALAQM